MALQDLMDVFYKLTKGVTQGVRAFIVQPYTEANVKRGKQFETSLRTTIPAGESSDIIFKTTTEKTLVKGRVVNFIGQEIKLETYEAPAYTGGTPVPVFNLTNINPVPDTVEILAGVTVTDTGTKISTDRTFFGDTNQGSKVAGSENIEGLERNFDLGKEYLQRISNPTTGPLEVSVYVSWYEGEPDFEGEG